MTDSDDDQDEALLETKLFLDREYQDYALRNEIYFAPVDDEEVACLAAQHKVVSRLLDDQLLPPVIPNPGHVLDCGYGSGAWSTDVAERYPDCKVIGIDIFSEMRPDDAPDNVYFEFDDLNRPFTPFHDVPNGFDFVHSRFMAGGIHKARWPSYIRDIAKVLKSGGWMQLVEMYCQVQSDNGTIEPNHALRQWGTKYQDSIKDIRDPWVWRRMCSLARDAGLVDVMQRDFKVPLCKWSGDPKLADISDDDFRDLRGFLHSLGLYPLTHRLSTCPVQRNFSESEARVLVDRARQEAGDPALKPYITIYICVGRKP